MSSTVFSSSSPARSIFGITPGSAPRLLVTAIVVAHDGARWLGDTLRALSAQSRAVDRVIGIDNGSRDGSGTLLAEAFGPASVLTYPRSTGFGSAVAQALRKLPAATAGQEWIWLLHDDCAPDQHALRELLRAASDEPGAAVLGPKLRDHLDRGLLLEAGVTVNRTGRRDTGLEPREYDQGQHDGLRDVLSVSTAGMLVRRDVWDEIGGFDPGLPLFRDDLDFCWRVRNAGHRVITVTDAVAWHAEASARRRRPPAASDHHPRRLDRRNAMFVVVVNLPFLAMLRALVRNSLGSVVRTAVFLLAKQPASALDEISALGSVLLHPMRIRRGRRRRRAGRKEHYPEVKHLLTPPGAGWRRFADMVQAFVSGEGPVDSPGRHHAGAVRAVTGEEPGEELLADSGVFRRTFASAGVLLTFLLVAVTLIAARHLLGGGALGGGALVPVVGSAADLWRVYIEDHHDIGLGTDAWAPPYIAVVAGVAALFFGEVQTAVAVLLVGCVPLAGVSAYLATRALVPSRYARFWLAATYALLPVGTGAVAAGRLGTAVVLILLPVYVGLGPALLARDRRRSRRAAWGFGLALAVGTAFVPLVYALVAVLCVLAAVAFGGVRPAVGEAVSIVLIVPAVLLLPWLIDLVEQPGRFLLEVGLHRADLVAPRLPAESLVGLSPGGPGLPPWWVTAGLIASALAALLMRRQRMIVAIGWGVTLFGLLVAILVSRVNVVGLNGGVPAPAWPGVPLALAAMGMLMLAALTSHRITELRRAGKLRKIAAFLTVVVAYSTPLLAAGYWMVKGVTGPLRSDMPAPLPPVVTSEAAPGDRVLMIRPAQGSAALTYTVLPGRAPLLGELDVPVPGRGEHDRFLWAASGLLAGRGDHDMATLAAFGVRFVVLAAPIDPATVRVLDAQPTLVRKTLGADAAVWRSLLQPHPPPARPDDGGGPHRWWLWGQGALLVVALVLAAPGARGERESLVPGSEAPHAAAADAGPPPLRAAGRRRRAGRAKAIRR
ncbi:glycosyltransferase family 2 protein [Sinosporangium siamense]|uniref:GT2 family glycosyltransferase n=1 Tax=Sinosporangium siamense TaxID=1367973 RepID=A0A919RBS6_9ACTN|nr:glycosyltransferase family 2 protein [Sinosporangium siamense]GII91026.1 hypothetical protein Ssi02_12570 [Sinosporangium siamense]